MMLSCAYCFVGFVLFTSGQFVIGSEQYLSGGVVAWVDLPAAPFPVTTGQSVMGSVHTLSGGDTMTCWFLLWAHPRSDAESIITKISFDGIASLKGYFASDYLHCACKESSSPC